MKPTSTQSDLGRAVTLPADLSRLEAADLVAQLLEKYDLTLVDVGRFGEPAGTSLKVGYHQRSPEPSLDQRIHRALARSNPGSGHEGPGWPDSELRKEEVNEGEVGSRGVTFRAIDPRDRR